MFTPSRHFPDSRRRNRVRAPRVRSKRPGDCATSPGVWPTLSRSVDVPKPSPQPSQPASTPTEHPRALGAVRLSNLTEVTTSPGRQAACLHPAVHRATGLHPDRRSHRSRGVRTKDVPLREALTVALAAAPGRIRRHRVVTCGPRRAFRRPHVRVDRVGPAACDDTRVRNA